MYACLHAHMHIFIYAHMHTCIFLYMHACIHVYMHACMHACMHTYTRMYVLAHTHTHLRTHIRTHMNICLPAGTAITPASRTLASTSYAHSRRASRSRTSSCCMPTTGPRTLAARGSTAAFTSGTRRHCYTTRGALLCVCYRNVCMFRCDVYSLEWNPARLAVFCFGILALVA